MKKQLKSVWLLLITAICIAICVVAFLGITTHYGDIDTVVIQSPKQITYDADLTDTITFVFAPDNSQQIEVTDEDINTVKTVIEKRLEYIGIPTYDIHCDYENKQVIVAISAETGVSTSWLATNLAARGDFYARAENSENAGESYIFSSDEVKSAKIQAGQAVMSYQQYTIEMHLNNTGKNQLKTTSEYLAEEFEKTEAVQYIYFYNGTTSIGSTTVKKAITDGVISLSSYNLDQDTVVQIGMYLNSGQHPFALTYDAVTVSNTAIGQDHIKMLGIALGSAFLAIFLFLIIRYRMTGVAGVICALGTIGVTMFFITGFLKAQDMPAAMPRWPVIC